MSITPENDWTERKLELRAQRDRERDRLCRRVYLRARIYDRLPEP